MAEHASRRWIYGGAAIYAGILVVVVVGLSLLYQGSRARLETALGDRLTAIATTATELVDPAQIQNWSLDPEEPIELLWLTTRFEEIQRANDLAELSLCDPSAFVLISASRRADRGQLNRFWDLDRPSVDLALEGFAAASSLYQSGPLYQKSAHAPVFDSEGQVVAVVTAEAAVDFFDTLSTLRDGTLSTGAVVVAFLLISGWAIVRLYRTRERYRTSLIEQENLAAMGRMTAGIAHEIRNPLGVIRGAGQHLKRRLAAAGIEDPVADFIPEEVDRLDRILTGYLSFGAGNETAPAQIDLAPVIHRTVRLMSTDLAGSGVNIECSASQLMVVADAQRMQQVLMNLILNARDAMPEGGTIGIRGATDAAAKRVTITISDEGEGPGEDPEFLFTAFQTSKEKGSGLGLAVSRQIVEAHQGTLTLRARTDRAGALATLTLPAAGIEA